MESLPLITIFALLNIALVVLVALITRKDMAVIASATMILGLVVVFSDGSQVQKGLMLCALNCFLAISAAAYNYLNHCNLSIVTSCLAATATLFNLIQMYDASLFSSIVTGITGWSLLAALTFMDGGTGLINGFIRDFRSTYRRVIYSLSHNSNDKGAH